MSDDRWGESHERRKAPVRDSVGFATWFAGMCAYMGRPVDPKVEAIYEKATRGIPVADLELVFQRIIAQADAPLRALVPVNRLLAAHRLWQEGAPAAKAPATPMKQSEVERARAVIVPLLARVLSGVAPVNYEIIPKWTVPILMEVSVRNRAGNANVADLMQLGLRMVNDLAASDYALEQAG